MADKKISQLSSASTPVAGTEVLPIVQSAATVKVSIDNLTKGRVVNALTFDTDVAAAGVTLTGTTLSADGTDANIDISVTPKGTGSVNLSKVNIDAGTIDGTSVGASSAASGAFTTLTSTSDAAFNSVSVGRGAASVTTNTAVGTSALAANQAGGTNNTAFGYQALDANTTGDQNTAVGQDALGAASTGTGNTAIGYGAGSAITTGSKNVVVGGYSGNSGGFDIRTSSNRVALSDGDGGLVQLFSGANTVYPAPQVSTELIRYTKTASILASSTTDIITFSQTAYQMNVGGMLRLIFKDTAYPNGIESTIANCAATTTTGDSAVRSNFGVVNTQKGSAGTISVSYAAATSKTGGVQDGVYKIQLTSGANTAGTVTVIFEGTVDSATIA